MHFKVGDEVKWVNNPLDLWKITHIYKGAARISRHGLDGWISHEVPLVDLRKYDYLDPYKQAVREVLLSREFLKEFSATLMTTMQDNQQDRADLTDHRKEAAMTSALGSTRPRQVIVRGTGNRDWDGATVAILDLCPRRVQYRVRRVSDGEITWVDWIATRSSPTLGELAAKHPVMAKTLEQIQESSKPEESIPDGWRELEPEEFPSPDDMFFCGVWSKWARHGLQSTTPYKRYPSKFIRKIEQPKPAFKVGDQVRVVKRGSVLDGAIVKVKRFRFGKVEVENKDLVGLLDASDLQAVKDKT